MEIVEAKENSKEIIKNQINNNYGILKNVLKQKYKLSKQLAKKEINNSNKQLIRKTNEKLIAIKLSGKQTTEKTYKNKTFENVNNFMEEITGHEEINQNTCGTCKHFYQHYILYHGVLKAIFCGHCAIKSLKKITPQHFCNCFENGCELNMKLVALISKLSARKKTLLCQLLEK